jgi:tetratricopeptide (TPR) repeat protein
MPARLASARWLVAWTMVGVFGLAGTIGIQMQLSKLPPPVLDVNMLFVPPAELTKSAATGFDNLIADGLWLSLIQYYGDRLISENRRFTNLAAMFDLIADLDPHFWFAFWLGSWALGDNGEADAAIRLLQKGERLNPHDATYPYQQGFVHFLFRKDYQAAAVSFERAASKPNADRFARTMAARMLQKQGRDEQALAVWQGLYTADSNKATKEIARRNIERIVAEMAGNQKRAFPEGPQRAKAP